jgi:hypothetical protein
MHKPQESLRQKTALDALRVISQEEIQELCGIINSHNKVRATNLSITPEQLTAYFKHTVRGMEYMLETYGDASLPSTWELMTGELLSVPSDHQKRHDFIGYDPFTDVMLASCLSVAFRCTFYGRNDARFADGHLPLNTGVSAEDYTVLQTIEECYHSYQRKALGVAPINTSMDPNHAIERAIIPVFERAVDDLDIPLFRLPSVRENIDAAALELRARMGKRLP